MGLVSWSRLTKCIWLHLVNGDFTFEYISHQSDYEKWLFLDGRAPLVGKGPSVSVLGHRPGWKDSCPFWPSFMTTGPFPPGSPRVGKSTHKANQSIHQAIELPAISPKPISNLLPDPSPVSTSYFVFFLS